MMAQHRCRLCTGENLIEMIDLKHQPIVHRFLESPHSGEDFSVPPGTPVRSPQRGRVVLASDLFFTGNTLVVDHGLGLYTFYAHLETIAVEAGAMVAAGELLGRVGSTGRVTGPHLHWAARVNDTRVDPLDLVSIPPATEPPTQEALQ